MLLFFYLAIFSHAPSESSPFFFKGTWTLSAELQDPGPSSLEETLPPQTDPTEHTDPEPKLESPTSNLRPAAGPAAAEASLPADIPEQTTCSAQGKKKKSFFSKGKKLFRKFGSSKKEWVRTFDSVSH